MPGEDYLAFPASASKTSHKYCWDYPACPVLVPIQLIIMPGEGNRSGVRAESNDRIRYDLKETIRSL